MRCCVPSNKLAPHRGKFNKMLRCYAMTRYCFFQVHICTRKYVLLKVYGVAWRVTYSGIFKVKGVKCGFFDISEDLESDNVQKVLIYCTSRYCTTITTIRNKIQLINATIFKYITAAVWRLFRLNMYSYKLVCLETYKYAGVSVLADFENIIFANVFTLVSHEDNV